MASALCWCLVDSWCWAVRAVVDGVGVSGAGARAPAAPVSVVLVWPVVRVLHRRACSSLSAFVVVICIHLRACSSSSVCVVVHVRRRPCLSLSVFFVVHIRRRPIVWLALV